MPPHRGARVLKQRAVHRRVMGPTPLDFTKEVPLNLRGEGRKIFSETLH